MPGVGSMPRQRVQCRAARSARAMRAKRKPGHNKPLSTNHSRPLFRPARRFKSPTEKNEEEYISDTIQPAIQGRSATPQTTNVRRPFRTVRPTTVRLTAPQTVSRYNRRVANSAA